MVSKVQMTEIKESDLEMDGPRKHIIWDSYF